MSKVYKLSANRYRSRESLRFCPTFPHFFNVKRRLFNDFCFSKVHAFKKTFNIFIYSTFILSMFIYPSQNICKIFKHLEIVAKISQIHLNVTYKLQHTFSFVTNPSESVSLESSPHPSYNSNNNLLKAIDKHGWQWSGNI